MTLPRIERRDSQLIITIEQQDFISAATRHGAADLVMADPERFLEFAQRYMFTLTHDQRDGQERASWWSRWTEALGRAAASQGAGVVERPREEPTCGCDPEVFDGG